MAPADDYPQILRKTQNRLIDFFNKARFATANPATVKELAEKINSDNLPYLELARQALAFLADWILTAKGIEKKRYSIRTDVENLKKQLDDFKELMSDKNESIDHIFMQAVVMLSSHACVLHIVPAQPRQGCFAIFCGWAFTVSSAKCNARDLDEVANQLSNLNKLFNTEYENFISKRGQKEKVLHFINKNLEGMRVVGVFGESGIGKTALLLAIYNELKSQQKHVLAYQEIGSLNGERQQSSKALENIQQDLLVQLQGARKIFNSTAQGRSELEECFKNLKAKGGMGVCLFLDNVSNANHLRELLPPNVYDILPPSSNLLFSSRSKDVVDQLGTLFSRPNGDQKQKIYKPYNLRRLDCRKARQLFIQTASSKGNDLLPDHEEIVQRIVPLCEGLPLALKVYGSYFREMQKRNRHEIAKVERQLKNAKDKTRDIEGKILESLEPSIDNQQKSIQDAFLDAALFFRGMRWDVATSALMDKGDNCLQCLLEQSLVSKFVKDGWDASYEIVAVNDLFFTIARRRAEQKKWIYVNDSSYDSHSPLQEEDEVRGINISDEKLPFGLQNSNKLTIMMMSHLRFLKAQRLSLLVSFLQSPLTTNELRFLELETEEELPELTMDIDKMPKLTVLNVCFNKIRLHFTNQELPVSIQKLTELPPRFGNWSSLQSLSLDKCTGLKELPSTLVNLSTLQRLHIEGCTSLDELPLGFGNLSSLQNLHIEGCTRLDKLPPTIGNLSFLQSLHIEGCTNIDKLPPAIGNLSSLQSLHIKGCTRLIELPPDVGKLRALQSIHLEGCPSLERLPSTLGNLSSLRSLKLKACTGLTELSPSLDNLSSLQSFQLTGCPGLKELPSTLRNLSALEI